MDRWRGRPSIMKHRPTSRRRRTTRSVPRLLDLEHAKAAVLNSLTSPDAQRGYRHASLRQVAAASIHRALTTLPPPVRRDYERSYGHEEDENSPMRPEAFSKHAHCLAQVSICVQFLALVRTLAEFFRLQHVRGPALHVATVAPYVGAGLLAALRPGLQYSATSRVAIALHSESPV